MIVSRQLIERVPVKTLRRVLLEEVQRGERVFSVHGIDHRGVVFDRELVERLLADDLALDSDERAYRP